MNSCESVREYLLECDWDETGLQRAFDAADHLRACPRCMAVVQDYIRMRSAMQSAAPEIPQGGWNALERRLLEKAVHRKSVDLRRWMAMAACALIALAGYGIGHWSNRPVAMISPPVKTGSLGGSRPSIDDLSQSDIAQRVKAFDEVSSVFEHRAAWMLVSDKASDMGVGARPLENQHEVLLLRLTMLKTASVISSADLVILPGQIANLTVPANENTSLHYRISTSADQPTHLTISTQLTTPMGTQVLAALATTLQVEPGQKLSAGNMVTDSGDYELQIAFGRAALEQSLRQ